MRVFLTLIITLISFDVIISQQIHSIHKEDYLQYGSEKKFQSNQNFSVEGIIPLQFDKSKVTGATIFGYLPDWEYATAKAYLRYDILTHIAAFDFSVSNTGAMSNPAGWPWTDVINTAHLNGVKVILTAVNFEGDDIHTIMTDPTVKQTFFNNVKSRMQAYQLDGVNIDFESLNSADRGAVLNTFMSELSTFIKSSLPNAEISFAGPALTSGYSLSGLVNSCDYIFIMGYAFYGSWSTTTGACAPLTGGSINITNTVVTQYAPITNSNPQKLILGVPYYGLKWKTQTELPHSTVISYIGSTRFKNDVTAAQQYGRLWASDNQVPWYRYQSANEWYQVWYDDDSSLGLKYSLAQSKNYRGVGMWALGYDGSRNELWNELYRRFYQTVPVELNSFTSQQFGNGVLLNWKTSGEINSRHFTLTRLSLSSGIHKEVGQVNAHGTTSTVKFYSYFDSEVMQGDYRYILSETSFDGKTKEIASTDISVLHTGGFSLEQNYPNPFNPSTTVNFSVPETGHIRMSVFDIHGSEVLVLKDEIISAGNHKVFVNLSEYSSGVYMLRMTIGNYMSSIKMILLK